MIGNKGNVIRATLVFEPARANGADDVTVRDLVQRGEHFGQHRRASKTQVQGGECQARMARDGADRGHQREGFEGLVLGMLHARSKAHQVVEQPDRVETLRVGKAGFIEDRVGAALLVKLHSKFHVLGSVAPLAAQVRCPKRRRQDVSMTSSKTSEVAVHTSRAEPASVGATT